ncbi:polyadenylate-binding protein-interacting protein 2B-like [Sycon ciliatum]|uniref:polyadenylate-binding protein-interacting protein 2B-like n=1 Tax=Sycon ciliatum TaxID=27933 RepID=UPI0020AC7DC8
MEQQLEFSEFAWMEHLEDFDREVERQLQEEDTISLEWHSMMDEEEAYFDQMREDELSSSNDSLSDLNPLADPFVPTVLEQVAL